MAATLSATFTFIRCVRGSLYGDTWNLVRLVHVSEILNCECEVKNPQNLYAVGLRKYDTTVGHVLRVISCICTLFFNKAYMVMSSVHFDWPTGNSTDSQDLPQGGLGLPWL